MYKPAQQFASENYVWGTCSKTCDNMAALGLKTVNLAAGTGSVSALGKSKGEGGEPFSLKRPWLGEAMAEVGAAESVYSPPPTPTVLASVSAAVVAAAVVVALVAKVVFAKDGEGAKRNKAEKIPLLVA